MNAKLRILLVIALFAAVIAVLFQDVLFDDRVLITSNTFMWSPWRAAASREDLSEPSYRTDAARTYYPRRVELSRSIASGRVPLWTPDVFCGYPFFADPQSRVLYPVSLLLVPVNPAKAMGYDVVIHFLIAMAGMYLFLRTAGGTVMGGLVGGLAFGLSSFFFLRTGHPTFVASASWIPWMFYAYERSARSALLGGSLLIIFLALGYLAGMTQIFMFAVAALLVYAIQDEVEGILVGDRRRALRKLGMIAVAGLISALVVAANLIPFIELLRNSGAEGFSYELMKSEHLWEPVFLLRSFAPDFFGNPVDGTSWLGLVKGAVHPYNTGFHVYCGAGALVMALSALVFVRVSRQVRGFLLLLALSVGLATSAAFLKIAYVVFPPAAYSQVDRVSVIACFAIAGLAGSGISLAGRAEAGSGRRRYSAIVILLALAAFAGYVVFVFKAGGLFAGLLREARMMAGQAWFSKGGFKLSAWVRDGDAQWLLYEKTQVGLGVLFSCVSAALVTVYLRWRTRGVALIAGSLLVLVLAADLMLAARRYYVTQPADSLTRTEGIDFVSRSLEPRGTWRAGSLVYLSPVFPANLPQVFGIPTFEGLNAVYPAAHARRVAWARGSGDALGPMGTATGRLGDLLSVRLFIGDRALADAGYATGFRPIYEGDLNVYDNPGALPKGVCIERDLFTEDPGRPGEAAEVKLTKYLDDLHLNICGRADILRYDPEEVVVSVDADSDCLFLFQDTYYPGWEALVDGVPAPILKTDLGIRALELERGTHRVEMKFSPRSLRLGMLLSGVGLLLTIVGLFLGAVYAGKAQKRQE
ncbi:MAG: hypothetical protein PVH52_00990 [bacterium]